MGSWGRGPPCIQYISCLFKKKRVIDQFVAVVAGQGEAKSVWKSSGWGKTMYIYTHELPLSFGVVHYLKANHDWKIWSSYIIYICAVWNGYLEYYQGKTCFTCVSFAGKIVARFPEQIHHCQSSGFWVAYFTCIRGPCIPYHPCMIYLPTFGWIFYGKCR